MSLVRPRRSPAWLRPRAEAPPEEPGASPAELAQHVEKYTKEPRERLEMLSRQLGGPIDAAEQVLSSSA
eukprot:6211016-Pleurochrysis_carterae.AAC.2